MADCRRRGCWRAVVTLVALSVAATCRADPPAPLRSSPSGRQTLWQYTSPKSEKQSMEYWLYEPANVEPGAKLATMIFLHGAGERTRYGKAEAVLKHGPPKLIEAGRDFPCRVVSPQCPTWWSADLVLAFTDYVLKTYAVDEDRLYLTGLSMGGMGTWDAGAARPDLFAALVPICGRCKDVAASAPRLASSWIWAFHGDADKDVDPQGTTEIVEAIKAAGGTRVQMTLYEGARHDSWTRTYDNPAVFEWMLSRKRDSQ